VRLQKLHHCTGVSVLSDYPLVSLAEGGLEIALGDLVSEEERVLVLALEVLPIPPMPDDTPAASLQGEALLDLEILYDELVPDGVTSSKEQRTIEILPVQSEADVKVNENAVKWVAEQTAGQAIAEGIVERDRGGAKALSKRLSSARERLARYDRPELTGVASQMLEEFAEASREWTARDRKMSRMFATRSLRTSSFYAMPQRNLRLNEHYEELKAKGSLAVDYARLGNDDPLPANAMDAGALVDRFTGCILGGAVGDALGRSLKGGSPSLRRKWLKDYQKWRGWKSGPKGTITDDTQFSMWLLQSLISHGGLEPHDLVRRFTAEKIRGIGKATLDFVKNAKVFGKCWFESGVASAGNGVAMRSAPIGLFYRDDFQSLKLGSILQAVITHNDPMAVASGILTAHAIALLLAMQPGDLLPLATRQEFCRRLANVIRGFEVTGDYRTRNTDQPITLEQRFRHDLPEWLEQNSDPIDINNEYWSGAYVLESLPHAFYCFLRTPQDFPETLLQAVNSSRDADTVAAIAGNLSGALNGVRAIPPRYLDDLEFRQDLELLAHSLLP
jgi:ADP-ribosylglycohydrolase